MAMKKIIMPTAVIIIAAAVAVIVFKNKGTAPTATVSKNEVLADPVTANTEVSSAQEADPVSLQALMQKQYDGRDLALGKILDNNSSYTRYYITYKSGQLTISGIMNVPKGNPPAGGFPVLVLNHGHIETSIYTNGRGLKREQDYLARQGYVVIHPDYRNHAQSDKDPEAETSLRLGYAEDVINAIYAVKNSELTFFNKENIGMLGHSMGGGVAINTMVVKPDLVKAFVLYAPVNADYRENFARWTERRPEIAQKVIELHGSPETAPEFWDNISAVNFLDQVNAPVTIFHGTNDSSVPYDWSTDLEKRLKDAGKQVNLVTFPGEAHEFGPRWNDFMMQSAEFFNQHLK